MKTKIMVSCVVKGQLYFLEVGVSTWVADLRDHLFFLLQQRRVDVKSPMDISQITVLPEAPTSESEGGAA